MAVSQTDLNDTSEELDSTLTASSTLQRANALSNKLSSVLSSSYADSEIRSALRELDTNHVRNTAGTRRVIRIDVQKEVIERNGDIIKDFGRVAERLKDIGTTTSRLDQCCQDIKQQVTAARQENAPVLEEATTLLSQKHDSETKKQLLDAFNKHFILSDQDLLCLTNTSEDVDDHFFAVLKRVKQIYVDCQILLGSENQRLGLELMDQSSRNLNVGYQKLYRWTQTEFKHLNLENPQISYSIRRALRALAERPSLFQSCLDYFAEAREHVLTNSFYAALTGSSDENNQNPMTKPIEFYAHDTLRYIGDMLAWTHSATVSEREALEGLFVSDGDEIKESFKAGKEAEPWTAEGTEAFDGRKALGDLVNQNVAGIARALRQRVDQVLHSHEDLVLLYRLANLFNFYRITFGKLLGPNSSLLETLSSLQDASLKQFRSISSDNINSIQAEVHVIQADLSPPEFLDEALNQLAALIKNYDSSLTPPSARTAEFQPVISLGLDPFLLVCEKMAQGSEQPEKSIFLTNCLSISKTKLGSSDFVQDRISEIDDQVENHVFILTEYQHAFFLHTSGLHPLLAALAPLDDSPGSIAKIHSLPCLQRESLTDASQSLDNFLPSALMDALENLKRLHSTNLAQDITAEAAERFCEDFEFVEGKLDAADEVGEGEVPDHEGEENKKKVPLKSLFPRTSGEIRVLLS